MKSPKNISNFVNELKLSLPGSTGEQRKKWAFFIAKNNIKIKSHSELLLCDNKIASRFLWLISDIAELDKDLLRNDLVYLFDLCITLNHIRIDASFANYWLICGVPVKKEGEYTDWLFKWLQSPETNVTTKSRSLFVLFQLTETYPELCNELKTVLNDQINKNTSDFNKRAEKILSKLYNSSS